MAKHQKEPNSEWEPSEKKSTDDSFAGVFQPPLVNYNGRDVGALYIMLSFYYCPRYQPPRTLSLFTLDLTFDRPYTNISEPILKLIRIMLMYNEQILRVGQRVDQWAMRENELCMILDAAFVDLIINSGHFKNQVGWNIPYETEYCMNDRLSTWLRKIL